MVETYTYIIWVNIELKKSGKLILFPSFLPHYQSLYQGTKDRIVIAFNASVFKREEV